MHAAIIIVMYYELFVTVNVNSQLTDELVQCSSTRLDCGGDVVVELTQEVCCQNPTPAGFSYSIDGVCSTCPISMYS